MWGGLDCRVLENDFDSRNNSEGRFSAPHIALGVREHGLGRNSTAAVVSLHVHIPQQQFAPLAFPFPCEYSIESTIYCCTTGQSNRWTAALCDNSRCAA